MMFPAVLAVALVTGPFYNYMGVALPRQTEHIVVEAPEHAWGIRADVRGWNELLPNTVIHVRLPGTDYRPKAIHIKVKIGAFDPRTYYPYILEDDTTGLAPWPTPTYFADGYQRSREDRTILLDPTTPNPVGDLYPVYKQFTAAHELGHTMGLVDNGGPGGDSLMSGGPMTRRLPNAEELAAVLDTLR